MNSNSSISILQQSGIQNPQRLEKLIRNTIDFIKLDLSGLTCVTEAASGPYVVTPVIASLAKAKHVIALTRCSPYATVDEVINQTRALESLCKVDRAIEIYTNRPHEIFGRADIITNLGFVRPLNKEIISLLKPTAVIPLMCETWEYRSGDLDLDACRSRGILVAGTNEEYPGLNVFSYSGWLCLKMLFDAQIEVHNCRLAIVGSDKFGKVIERRLTCCGADVTLMPRFDIALLGRMDAVIIADYTREDEIIGSKGDVTPLQVASVNPAVSIIQFAGQIDIDGLRKQGIFVYPGSPLPPYRMMKTLANLGPRPVIELHTAGLKVGEYLIKSRSTKPIFDKLIQPLD